MTNTLQNIIYNHKSLEELILENDGIISDEQQEQILDSWMAENKNQLVEKIDSYAYKIKSLEQAAESIKEKSKIMTQKARALENLSSNLNNRLFFAMKELGLDIIESRHTFKIKKNPPSLIIENEDKIPLVYKVQEITWTVDKEKLKQDLKSMPIDGARLEQKERLEIK